MTVRPDAGPLTEDDLHLFNEGRHFHLWERLGAHPLAGQGGVSFAVWAPGARSVSVVGEWNGWTPGADPLAVRGESGLWEGVVAEARPGHLYKYRVESRSGSYWVDKADPVAFAAEPAPGNASRVTDLAGATRDAFEWGDGEWMASRRQRQAPGAPLSIYEVHPGSWRRPEDGRRFLSYRELAEPLADHAERCGFTHVELMPVMEHPFYGSWGYQVTGYFAATSRYGSPEDLMYLIDHLHRRGLGVILDWVPSHFATDEHGLGYFDGTHLYEHADPRQGYHPDWGSYIFNYGRREVVSFLVSSALFWLDVYHADGLRVDAVASMLYLDYSREEGEWVPNREGGRENLEAVGFLRTFNQEVHRRHPGALTIAEESTSWPGVTAPVEQGGLGFDLKWDMGWMNDRLSHFSRQPKHRRWHHREMTFRGLYRASERFCLPLSHDEVVHGKKSLLGKMPGDGWQMRANLRLLLADQALQPGKKLLFMGGELGSWWEWAHEGELPWFLLEQPGHAGLLRLVGDLNRLYREEPALHQWDLEGSGFEWIEPDDAEGGVVSWLRWSAGWERPVAVVLHLTPEVHRGYRVGLPRGGRWRQVLSTDAERYGGSGVGGSGAGRGRDLEAREEEWQGRPFAVELDLPPLAAVALAPADLAAGDAGAEDGGEP